MINHFDNNNNFNCGSPFGQNLGFSAENDFASHQNAIFEARNYVNMGLPIEQIAFQSGLSIAELKANFIELQ